MSLVKDCKWGPGGQTHTPTASQALGTCEVGGRGGGREQRGTHGAESPQGPWEVSIYVPQDRGQPSPPSMVVPWTAPGHPATPSAQMFPTCHPSRHPPGKNLFKAAPDIILGIVPSPSRRPTAGPSPWWHIIRVTTLLSFSFLEATLPRPFLGVN